MTQAFGIFCSR